MTASIVEQQSVSAEAAAEVARWVVLQPAAELAAAEATRNERVAGAPRPSSSSNQGSLLETAVLVASQVASPQAVESVAQPQAALVLESEALVAHLKLNSTPTPRSGRDRNWVSTVPAVRAK